MGRGASVDWDESGQCVRDMLKTLSIPHVSKATGVSADAIRGYCARNGIKVKRHNLHLRKLDDHDIELMVLLRLDGMTLAEVAEKFDVKYQTASMKTCELHKLLKLRLKGFSLAKISEITGYSVEELKEKTDNAYKQVERH